MVVSADSKKLKHLRLLKQYRKFQPPRHGLIIREGTEIIDKCLQLSTKNESIKIAETLMNQSFRTNKKRARDGTRTRGLDLGKVALHQLSHSRILVRIGVTGFEPATSWSQTRRSSQAEPHPVIHVITLFDLKIYIPSKLHTESLLLLSLHPFLGINFLFTYPILIHNLLVKPSTD